MKRDPHTPACERHTLAHVSHAQMGEGLVDVLLALVESGDDGEHSGKVLVTLSLV